MQKLLTQRKTIINYFFLEKVNTECLCVPILICDLIVKPDCVMMVLKVKRKERKDSHVLTE